MEKRIRTVGDLRQVIDNLPDDFTFLMPDDLRFNLDPEAGLLILEESPGGNLVYDGPEFYRSFNIVEIDADKGTLVTEHGMRFMTPEQVALHGIAPSTKCFELCYVKARLFANTDFVEGNYLVDFWMVRSTTGNLCVAVSDSKMGNLLRPIADWNKRLTFDKSRLYTMLDYREALILLHCFTLFEINFDNSDSYISRELIDTAIDNPSAISIFAGWIDDERVYDAKFEKLPTCLTFLRVDVKSGDASAPAYVMAVMKPGIDESYNAHGFISNIRNVMVNKINPGEVTSMVTTHVRPMNVVRYDGPSEDQTVRYSSLVDAISHGAAILESMMQETDLISFAPDDDTLFDI